jgi:hypothetical protein
MLKQKQQCVHDNDDFETFLAKSRGSFYIHFVSLGYSGLTNHVPPSEGASKQFCQPVSIPSIFQT